jgi:hypothetical protein
MERTDLMVGEGENRHRARRIPCHRPGSEIRQYLDERMLSKGNALMRFAPFPTINSVLSNAAELRRQSRHVFGFPMGNRLTMKWRDGASEIPHSNEGCDQSQGGTPRTPMDRGTAVADFKEGFPTEHQRLGATGI